MTSRNRAGRQLHLASASPRRREILASLGVPHSYAGTDVDETPEPGEQPGRLALRLALAKARAARPPGGADTLVLAADTVVALGSEQFGKPANEAECLSMLARLSGRVHTVCTAIALLDRGVEHTALSVSEVRFRPIGTDEARAYFATGEPLGKAGGYAIQGLGGIFVEALSGSYSGVMGLPVFETAALLGQAGIDLLAQGGAHPAGEGGVE